MTATQTEHLVPDAQVVMTADQIRSDRTAWLEARKSGVGGSDIAALMGDAKYGDTEYSVWLDKTGRTWDIETTEAMEWGNRLEDSIAVAFAERLDVQVQTAGLLRSATHPRALASADRLVSDGGGLECKNTSVWLRKEWADGGFPRAHYWQCVQGLAVTGLPHWWLVGLIGGNHLEVRRVNREDVEGDIDTVLERCEAWWDYVETDTAPEQGAPVDLIELIADAVETANPEAVAADLERWAAILADEKAMDEEKKEIQARMVAELNGHKALMLGGVPRVRLIAKKGNATFNTKKFKADDPETAKQYVGTGAASVYPQLIKAGAGVMTEPLYGLYRTVITVEVLSNYPVDHLDLADIAHEIVDGDSSGAYEVTSVEEVSRERMAELLEAQGSDPSFLLGATDEEGDPNFLLGPANTNKEGL